MLLSCAARDQSIAIGCNKLPCLAWSPLQLLLLISAALEMATSAAVDHCYSDIGCFPLSEDFYHPQHRPFNVRPWHRKHIGTKFELFNPHHPNGHLLVPWNRLSLIASRFDPRLETKVILPGWLDNINRAVWVKQLKDSLLWLWSPVNVVVVRWRNFTPYTIATANTRVVGAELANLIKFIEHELAYDRSYYHLIGHSLGAHIGGYAGDRLPGLGRITALDPARPFFQHMPKSVRLDRADAKFVDAIHSDFTPENAIFLLMSFGMTTPIGHVDFYPNGPPLLQPGCLRDTLTSVQRGIIRGLEHSSLSVAFLEAVRYLTACDHQRAHEWFIESIVDRRCVFVGVRCNEFEGLINGRCSCDDSRSACAIMGIHADQMYLNNAHQDVWPRPASARPRPPVIVEEDSEETREQIYSRLKQQAHLLRQPLEPQAMVEFADKYANLYEPLEANGQSLGDQLEPETLQDMAFVEYLRANLLMNQALDSSSQQQQIGHYDPLTAGDQLLLSRRMGVRASETKKSAHLTPRASIQLDGQSVPMSSRDRDIEDWYEGTSRWFLKTNNRPSYCSNQYQLLVFVGPLRSSNGRDRLRANLLVSIIGSRGQLINQRFVPRSSKLNSFTMQPFFILLEGSYSLGQIQSLAISWEARLDPEPVQATISFQSNLLESIEPYVPALKARHPWLPETVKHDKSEAFVWRGPPASGAAALYGAQYRRRSSQSTGFGRHRASGGCHEQPSATGSGAIGSRLDGHCQRKLTGSAHKLPASSSTKLKWRQHYGYESVGGAEAKDSNDEATADDNHHHQLAPALPQLELFVDKPGDDLLSSPSSFLAPLLDRKPGDRFVPLSASQADELYEATLDLHNIDLGHEPSIEESIVIIQVIVSPIQASYGRLGRIAKTFCPPRPGFRLHREQTVRMVPTLLGRCRNVPILAGV